MMILSIVIANFNSNLFLKKCLLTIKESSLSTTDYEIIIVDNNSTDISIKEALSVQGLNIILIKNKENVGFAKANNQGIKKSNGKYILLLNPDTLLSENVLPDMLKKMENYPKAGIATCKVLLPSRELDDACHRGFPTPWNALCHFSGISGLFPDSKFFNGYHLGYQSMDKTHEIDACTGAFMLIRRQAGEEVNWLDEDYFWYGEDLDFCYKVTEKGWKIMFIPDISITHFKGISSGIKKHSQDLSTATAKTRQFATRARFDVMRIFYEKHYANTYPKWITNLVFKGIKLKQWISSYHT